MSDRIEEDYKALACYKEMDSQSQEKFDNLAKYYGSILNEGPQQTVTVYTSHDFDRHCFDLYRIISIFLLDERAIRDLSNEELYLLNLSVLLHDISMCQGGYEGEVNTAFDRRKHSLQSAEWIQHEFDLGHTPLYRSGLTANQVKIICDICRAHSTLKDRDNPSGLFEPTLPFVKTGRMGTIRVKALAGILRIADELDATRDRLVKSEDMAMLLSAPADDGRPEVQEFIKQNEESRKHFGRLLLIRGLEQGEDITTITLKLDENQVRKRLKEGDEANLAEDLRTIRRKIQKELNELWSEVLSRKEADAKSLISLRNVVWSSEDEKFIERLLPDEKMEHENLGDISDGAGNWVFPVSGAGHSPGSAPAQERIDATEPQAHSTSELEQGADSLSSSSLGEDGGTGQASGWDIRLLNAVLSQKISQQVLAGCLLRVGHYQLNSIHCARDWIDTEEFLNHSPLTNDIIAEFSSHISTTFRTTAFTIVGLDLIGALTAAQIGFMLEKPFTYVIPAHQHSRSDLHEVHVPDIPEGHKIVLVTDSIVTGLTVSQIIQKNGWGTRMLAIYTVFYRKPKSLYGAVPIQFPCTINVLNADFPAEIALVSECPYGKYPENCQAENIKL